MTDNLDVLVIAPHPDDAELGMGGAIVKMVSEGLRVGILDLTSGEPTPYGDEVTRRKETAAATQVLGIAWRENLGLTNRKLQPTLDARHALANLFRRVRPKWLFAPFGIDAHPDHVSATQLIQDARFWSKLTKSDLAGDPYHPRRIYYYFCMHLKMAIQPAFVLDISQQWERKQAAMECFHSQLVQGRDTEIPPLMERIRIHHAYWGNMIGVEYGEPFTTREPLGLSSLSPLI